MKNQIRRAFNVALVNQALTKRNIKAIRKESFN